MIIVQSWPRKSGVRYTSKVFENKVSIITNSPSLIWWKEEELTFRACLETDQLINTKLIFTEYLLYIRLNILHALFLHQYSLNKWTVSATYVPDNVFDKIIFI